MFEIIIAVLKILAFMMFVAAAYKSGQHYKNKSKAYEKQIETKVSKEERRRRAIEHFEAIEKWD